MPFADFEDWDGDFFEGAEELEVFGSFNLTLGWEFAVEVLGGFRSSGSGPLRGM